MGAEDCQLLICGIRTNLSTLFLVFIPFSGITWQATYYWHWLCSGFSLYLALQSILSIFVIRDHLKISQIFLTQFCFFFPLTFRKLLHGNTNHQITFLYPGWLNTDNLIVLDRYNRKLMYLETKITVNFLLKKKSSCFRIIWLGPTPLFPSESVKTCICSCIEICIEVWVYNKIHLDFHSKSYFFIYSFFSFEYKPVNILRWPLTRVCRYTLFYCDQFLCVKMKYMMSMSQSIICWYEVLMLCYYYIVCHFVIKFWDFHKPMGVNILETFYS